MKQKNMPLLLGFLFFIAGCEIDQFSDTADIPEGETMQFVHTSGATGQQPFENFTAVPQGSAQCGPASFYMIFNHFNDHGLYTGKDCSTAIDQSAKLATVTKDTAIVKYINNGSTAGTTWEQLKDAADGLYKNCAARYTSELNNRFTDYHVAADEAEREKRFAYIVRNYLKNNRPVIIHLKRLYLFSGHYVVLIGYDESENRVYYADPNKGRICSAAYDDFIREKFYVSPDNSAAYYRARWDGEWMGFYTLGNGVEKAYYIRQDKVLDSVEANKAAIINADDFGQNSDVNSAVNRGFCSGIVTSASMQVPYSWSTEALSLLEANTVMESGIHFTLTCSSDAPAGPVSGSGQVPSLVADGIVFPDNILPILSKGKIDEIRKELNAQYNAALSAGMDITHIDCHQGFTQIGDTDTELPYLEIAQKYNIPVRWLGDPFSEKLLSRGIIAPTRTVLPVVDKNIDDFEDYYIDRRDNFIKELRNIKYGEIVEFILHPMAGDPVTNYHFKHIDNRLVQDPEVKRVIADEKIALVGYKLLREIQRKLE